MKIGIKVFSASVVAILSIPAIALAHAKWLVEESEEIIEGKHGTIDFYSWQSPEVLAWCAIGLIVIIAALFIDAHSRPIRTLEVFVATHRNIINRVAQAVLGIFLVSVGLFWNVVIMPSIEVNDPVLVVLKVAQIVIGILLILNLFPRIATACLLILCALVTLPHGLEAVLENAILFSLAAYFFIIHSSTKSIPAFLKIYALDIVRIGTGISLITLAFTEKLLYPEWSLQFLAEHPWNFMMPLFPWFSDNLFVLSTGFAEMLFGIVFILGYVPRITTIFISLFFMASVTAMLIQSHVWEVEDFVVYCSAILLLFFGRGETTLFGLLKRLFTDRRLTP